MCRLSSEVLPGPPCVRMTRGFSSRRLVPSLWFKWASSQPHGKHSSSCCSRDDLSDEIRGAAALPSGMTAQESAQTPNCCSELHPPWQPCLVVLAVEVEVVSYNSVVWPALVPVVKGCSCVDARSRLGVCVGAPYCLAQQPVLWQTLSWNSQVWR